MGVENLWQLVACRGVRMRLALLSHKILAIDASMWIYQFMRGLKDADGGVLPGAHILGFFRRICKLLALKIKPVFVFDGPPPALKFATLRLRKDEHALQTRRIKLLAQRILRSRLEGGTAGGAGAQQTAVDLSPSAASPASSCTPEEVLDLTAGRWAGRPQRPPPLPPAAAGAGPPLSLADALERPCGKEQYRGLLKVQQQLQAEVRHWAVSSHSSADFSASQTRHFVETARLHDLVKGARVRMAQEEELKPPGSGEPAPKYVPPESVVKKRKRGTASRCEFAETSGFCDEGSRLSREQLLFGDLNSRGTAAAQQQVQVRPDGGEESDSLEPEDVAALFGWAETRSEVVEAAVRVPSLRGSSPSPSSGRDSAGQPQSPGPGTGPGFVASPSRGMASRESPASPGPGPGWDSPVVSSSSSCRPARDSPSLSSSSRRISSGSGSSLSLDSGSCGPDQAASPSSSRRTPSPSRHSPALSPALSSRISSGSGSPSPGTTFSLPEGGSSPRPEGGGEGVSSGLPERGSRQEMDEYTSWDLAAQLERFQELRELLRAFGLPYVTAPSEAEAQCAALSALELVDGVISDDSDTLVFGANQVFRAVFGADGGTVQMYKGGEGRDEVGFSREQLICLAMLLGCDYTVGVHGVGIVNAAEIVQVYRDFDGLGRLRKWAERRLQEKTAADAGTCVDDREKEEDGELREFKEKHAKIRATWAFPDNFPSVEVWNAFASPQVDLSDEPFSWGTIDEARVVQVVHKATGVAEEKLHDILRPVLMEYARTDAQRKITDYFGFQLGAVAELRSERLKRALRSAAHSAAGRVD